MEGLLTKLIEVLERENGIYKDILDISRHKTEIIVEGKVTELDRMTGIEQKMVFNVGQLEKQREELLREMAQFMDIGVEEINMDHVIDEADGHLKDRFSKIREEISATLKELKEVNDLNSQLIEKSLEYIDFFIDLITDNSSGTIYSNRRDKDKGERVSFFDQKA